jgi:hypothetical protein
VSFDAKSLCVASYRVFVVVLYFIIDSVRKLLDTRAYISGGRLLYERESLTDKGIRKMFVPT